jgi:hypothetical protein
MIAGLIHRLPGYLPYHRVNIKTLTIDHEIYKLEKWKDLLAPDYVYSRAVFETSTLQLAQDEGLSGRSSEMTSILGIICNYFRLNSSYQAEERIRVTG